ncbi:MAG: F0F1 ATP synthase subunit A [Chloroflexi bacterium]|nr:F0F1 ATP synthase subunit A [Chloroflexota bacterium]
MKLGCSGRLFLLIVVALAALTVLGFLVGALGASFLGRSPFTGAPRPELPPEVIAQAGPLLITNTMITAWLSIILLVVLFWASTRKMKLVPKGLQNLAELVIETLANFVEGVVGKERGRRFFPIIATIFLFVFVNAWMGLIPGYGSVGLHEEHGGETILVPLLRAANTDLNVPLALALVSFVFVEAMGIAYNGFFKYMGKFVNLGPFGLGLRQIFSGKLRAGLSGMLMGIVQAFVGLIETFSEFIRIVSFTFRLFGNMTAGEILLLLMFFLLPFVIPMPFYLLEAVVGLIQALIFAGLTLVFVAIATTEHAH